MPGAVPSDITVEPLTDWLYCLRTPVVAVYAIECSGGFVLVDCGVVGYERAYLEALGTVAGCPPHDVRVTEILLTHGHDDHTGSAAALSAMTGARVLGPALEADVIEGKVTRADPQLLDWEIPLFARFGHVVPAPPVSLDGLVEEGDMLDWGRPVQIVGVPGHTTGSVAAFLPEDHVVIAGDAITTATGEPMLGVFNVDPEQAKESFRRLAQLDASIVCVGHGPAVTGDAQSQLARVKNLGGPPGASA
ncbi:MAG TPA: MBL fold metallo-hydrolase [Solirubrobacteraceae bacterium]|nr:MBL fold metallo-hydrolase [Solirubrobacteraceae bacterium]